jgi:uncharacterized protein (DUF1800 family)
MSNSTPLHAAIAAHRFGLGEPSLAVVGDDAAGWLTAQIGPADAAQGDGLLGTHEAVAHVATEREARRRAKNPPPGMPAEQLLASHYREVIFADTRSRLLTAARTARPFAERLQLFWANHFTVSLAKGSTRGLIGAFERDAIRPHIAGSFEALLLASTPHPAMLRYLDNTQSAGPNSTLVARAAKRAAASGEPARVSGLNENLAREVLELHTLGAASARGPGASYTQADVTAFAAVLTGWRVGVNDAVNDGADPAQRFDPAWHEPGRKTLLGHSYPEGPDGLRRVLHDLALHPATARFIATKLARHFVADDPPPDLVARLADAWQRSSADLPTVYRELIRSPEAWSPQPVKLKTPEELVLAAARVLQFAGTGMAGAASGFGKQAPDFSGIGASIAGLGQRVQAAPSPAGWSDRAEDWLGPDAVWKRIEWSTRLADRFRSSVDARALAAQSLGPLLSDATRTQIERAADGSQALALLLMAPEFQRR